MLVSEWDLDDSFEGEKEDGYEKGREEGREEGIKTVLKLLSRGYTLEAIKTEMARTAV